MKHARADQCRVADPGAYRGAARRRVGARDKRRSRRELGGRPASGDECPPQVSAAVIAICDTGPLVAYLNRNDPYHAWAVALMKQVRAPMLICEPVLTEVAYFLREDGLAVNAGLPRDEYIRVLVSRDLQGPRPVDEILSEFRAEVTASGLSDAELTDLFIKARDDVRARS